MQTDEVNVAHREAQKPHSLIASDRVEGTPVRRADGAKIGTIQRLMIDKLTGNVAYAVLSFWRIPQFRAETCADSVGAAHLRSKP